MTHLLDTNIVIRAANPHDPMHSHIGAALAQFTKNAVELCITRQNLYEFWVAATRPADVNGMGITSIEARRFVEELRASCILIPDPPDLLEGWLDLCTSFAVRGRPAHDARLVACMQGNGISHLVTLNPGDFARYPGIECIVPI